MESQFQSQPVPAVHRYPDEVPDGIARMIQDDLNHLSWTPNRDIEFATNLHRFLTDYATEARCLAYSSRAKVCGRAANDPGFVKVSQNSILRISINIHRTAGELYS
jgi:hypothetical protein